MLGRIPNRCTRTPNSCACCTPTPQILIPRQQDDIAHGSVARECDHVGDDQRINTFLLTCLVNESESDLETRKISERNMLCRWPRGCSVVPIHTEQIDVRDPAGKSRQRLHDFLCVQDDAGPRDLLADQSNGSLGKQVPGIYENGDATHNNSLESSYKTEGLPKEPSIRPPHLYGSRGG